jgi:type II secretory pathway pseudopilin PulG
MEVVDKQADQIEAKAKNWSAFLNDIGGRIMKEKTRSSYVELITIAIVLSVVAMTAVPKFIEASTESKTCELIDGLQRMRAQLDLYRAQHENSLPSVDSFESFKTAMTRKEGQYGPYIGKIPVNPFNNLNTVRFDGEPAGAGTAGWRLNTKNGLFQADDCAAHADF